jgi:hypothetical protein
MSQVNYLSDDALYEARQLLREGAILAMCAPSPFFEHSPETWRKYQQFKNNYLKMCIKFKRENRKPIKPLPLP